MFDVAYKLKLAWKMQKSVLIMVHVFEASTQTIKKKITPRGWGTKSPFVSLYIVFYSSPSIRRIFQDQRGGRGLK